MKKKNHYKMFIRIQNAVKQRRKHSGPVVLDTMAKALLSLRSSWISRNSIQYSTMSTVYIQDQSN